MNLTRVYLVGVAFIGVATVAIGRAKGPAVAPAEPLKAEAEPVQAGPHPIETSGTARGWFATIKPFCNTVEVETALQRNPAPAEAGFEGAGYQAACLALAGTVERARRAIETVGQEDRRRAAGIVFEVAHPVADAGDDRSAGPIMAMVVDFWPNHYMALYHAGISELALGDPDRARRHLEAFLQHYTVEDGWRSSARAALERIGR